MHDSTQVLNSAHGTKWYFVFKQNNHKYMLHQSSQGRRIPSYERGWSSVNISYWPSVASGQVTRAAACWSSYGTSNTAPKWFWTAGTSTLFLMTRRRRGTPSPTTLSTTIFLSEWWVCNLIQHSCCDPVLLQKSFVCKCKRFYCSNICPGRCPPNNFSVVISDFGSGADYSCLATILDILSAQTIAFQLMVCNSEVTNKAFSSAQLRWTSAHKSNRCSKTQPNPRKTS